MSATWDGGTVPCLSCRREVRADRSHCPFCGEPLFVLPGVIAHGYAEGTVVGQPREGLVRLAAGKRRGSA